MPEDAQQLLQPPLQRTDMIARVEFLDMVRGISDDRTGRIAECQHSRERTFQEFMAARAPSQLVPPTTKIKDVPLMTNPEEYFRLLFTPEVHESADAFSGRLQARAQKAPVQACSFDDETSQLIRESYPQFQIAVIGKEGAGKSTTARWLAHHLWVPAPFALVWLSFATSPHIILLALCVLKTRVRVLQEFTRRDHQFLQQRQRR